MMRKEISVLVGDDKKQKCPSVVQYSEIEIDTRPSRLATQEAITQQ